MAAVAGLYRRILPFPAIDFACREGKEIFREALEDGTMEGFFKLIAHFQTQAEPAFCGLASLSVVLNSLAIDPGRTWKGPWRWFDESMLDCCEPLEKVKSQGISFAKVACLGECSGARVEAVRANQSSLVEFRQLVHRCCSSDDQHMIASYNRKLLQQTGSGHFSPIGGYHQGKDLALILDVARFKYPPHWVPLEVLWDAVNTIDASTGKSRGFLLVTKPSQSPSLLFTSSCKLENWRDVCQYLSHDLATVVQGVDVSSAEDLFSVISDSFPGTVSGFVKWIAEARSFAGASTTLDAEEEQRVDDKTELLHQLRDTRLYKQLSQWLSKSSRPCLLSGSTLSEEVGEACCQAAALLCGGAGVNGAENCFSCCKLSAHLKETDATGRGAVVIGDDGIQVIVPVTGSCRLLHPTPVDVFTVLLLAQPVETWSGIRNSDVKSEFNTLVSIDGLPPLLRHEIQHLQRQLRVLNCNED